MVGARFAEVVAAMAVAGAGAAGLFGVPGVRSEKLVLCVGLNLVQRNLSAFVIAPIFHATHKG